MKNLHQSSILTIFYFQEKPKYKIEEIEKLIEEYGAKLVYKLVHKNIVADALLLQEINNTKNCSDHSQQSSPAETMKKVKQPLNSLSNNYFTR